MEKDYIYIREHWAHTLENACKLGKTHSIIDRDSHYATAENTRGKFILVFEVDNGMMDDIEYDLINVEFVEYATHGTGGKEYFRREIIPLIEPYFIKWEINYKKLSEEDIAELTRTVYEKKPAIIQEIKPRNYRPNRTIIKRE